MAIFNLGDTWESRSTRNAGSAYAITMIHEFALVANVHRTLRPWGGWKLDMTAYSQKTAIIFGGTQSALFNMPKAASVCSDRN